MNPKILYGNKPLGVPEVKGRPPTTFEEFNLSYKKPKLNNNTCMRNDVTPRHNYNNLSSNKKRIYSGNLRNSLLGIKRKGGTDNKDLSKRTLDFGGRKS